MDPLLKMPVTELEAGAVDTKLELVSLVASREGVTDTAVLSEEKTDEAKAEVGSEETLELEANAVLEETIEELEVVVRSTDELAVVDDVVVVLDAEVVTAEDVVRLARRLEAEADDELVAAVETPTLSALMISAACGRSASARITHYSKPTFSATAYTTA